jgi:hypothetical protein
MVSVGNTGQPGGRPTRLKTELKSLALMMLFFTGWLVPLLIIKNLLLDAYEVPSTQLPAAIIGALILSKVVVVLEHVSLGSWVASRPAWVDVMLRTLLYGAGVAVVLLLEKAFEGRHEMGGFWRSLAAVLHHPDINHVWVNTICVTGALFSYNLLAVLRRHLNGQTVLGLLAKPLPEQTNTH